MNMYEECDHRPQDIRMSIIIWGATMLRIVKISRLFMAIEDKKKRFCLAPENSIVIYFS